MSIPVALLVLLASPIATSTTVLASTADQVADRVLGQFGLTDNTPNFGGPSALDGPMGAAVDGQGHLYIVDSGNNRVLGFASAAKFTNGAPADLVIGQTDFYSDAAGYPTSTASTLNEPMAAATDPAGNLYVADFIDNRVLEYDAPFASGLSAGESASIIFGNTTSSDSLTGCQIGQPAPSADNLCGPTAVASDTQGNLYVTDSGYNRVLVYLNAKATGGGTPGSPGSVGDTTADLVIGQNNSFTRFLPCTTTLQPTTASSLCVNFGGTGGLALDQKGNLFVADVNNMRVLKYDTPLNPHSGEPGAGDTIADLVIGQRDLTTAAQCSRQRRASARVLCYPIGVAIDPSADVYITDANRVLEFNTPASNNPIARRVYGEKTFGSDFCGSASAKCLSSPMLPAIDGGGRLYVPDFQNNRVLSYDMPLVSTTATRELGQVDFVHRDVNFPGARSLHYPFATTVDTSGHLYVTDAYSSRVLGWANASGFSNGQPADLVIGQPDFYSTGCHLLGPPPSPPSGRPVGGHAPKLDRDSPLMCSPQGLAADSTGHLVVSDTENSRLMIYANPFDGCAGKFPCVGAPPIAIMNGQERAFPCRKPSADTLCVPDQLAIDGSDNLWVADSANSRVLLFKNPIGSLRAGRQERTQIISLNAQLVVGQGPSSTRFNTGTCDDGNPTNPTPSADTLCNPDGVAVDGDGNVYVSDSSNGRLLEYDNPLASPPGTPGVPGSAGDVTSDLAFDAGGSFTLRDCGTTADQLCVPGQLAADAQNNLYAVDGSRVLEYLDPTAPGGGTPGKPGSSGDTTSDVAYGQEGSFIADFCNGNDFSTIVNATTLCQTTGVAVDRAGDVFIVDSMNNRLLAFTSQGSN